MMGAPGDEPTADLDQAADRRVLSTVAMRHAVALDVGDDSL
jgi:hypothetical protein